MNGIMEAIRSLRADLGETQHQFAKRIGVSWVTLARYESGEPVSPKSLNALYKEAVNSGHATAEDFFKELGSRLSASNAGITKRFSPPEARLIADVAKIIHSDSEAGRLAAKAIWEIVEAFNEIESKAR